MGGYPFDINNPPREPAVSGAASISSSIDKRPGCWAGGRTHRPTQPASSADQSAIWSPTRHTAVMLMSDADNGPTSGAPSHTSPVREPGHPPDFPRGCPLPRTRPSLRFPLSSSSPTPPPPRSLVVRLSSSSSHVRACRRVADHCGWQ